MLLNQIIILDTKIYRIIILNFLLVILKSSNFIHSKKSNQKLFVGYKMPNSNVYINTTLHFDYYFFKVFKIILAKYLYNYIQYFCV